MKGSREISRMGQIKREYFINGVDNQKRPDVIFNLKRCDIKKLKKLPEMDRSQLAAFLMQCQNDIQETINELKA